MYKDYFGLKERPFSLAPDPRYLFMSQRHQEALAHLLYGAGESGGFIALTGEVGTGKTTLCHCLLEQLPEDVDIALILNPRMNALELLGSLCDELRVSYPADTDSLKVLVDLLNNHLLSAHAKGRRTVAMIDEAQNLSFEVLEQIRLLTNLETTQTKLLHIILVGQPELNQLLAQKNLRQLNQRITARYYLEPLSLRETSDYIHHRLSISGTQVPLFTPSSIRTIYRYSHGTPRLINNICDRALLGAYSCGHQRVSPSVVHQAAAEVLPRSGRLRYHRPARWLTAIIVLSLTSVVAAVFLERPQWRLPTADIEIATAADSKVVVKKELPPPSPPAPKQDLIEPEPTKPPLVTTELVTTTKTDPTVEQSANFAELITNPDHTLEAAFGELFDQWSLAKTPPTNLNCEGAVRNGLRCLAQHGSWQQMIGFNRPVILEFDLAGTTKRYATLVALNDQQVTLQFGNQRYPLPREQVAAFWHGNYMLLWKPLDPTHLNLSPGVEAPGVAWLHQQLTPAGESVRPATGANYFDNKLKSQVITFQRAHQLRPDGVVGPQTFIHLNNKARTAGIPKLDSATD